VNTSRSSRKRLCGTTSTCTATGAHASWCPRVYFELGRLAATRRGDDLGSGILFLNSTWAHAKKGAADNARTLVDRGRDRFAAPDHSDVPGWARFCTEADLAAVSGAVHTDLAHTAGPRHARTAIPLLTEAIAGYDDEMARSRAFSLILLSINHLLDGDADRGTDFGLQALASAQALGSARVRDRIRPLGLHARRHPSHAGAVELAQSFANVATISILQVRALKHSEMVSEQLQNALNNRIMIERAKGILTERLQIGVADAFSLMRTYARNNNQLLSDIAQQVIARSPEVADLTRIAKTRSRP
jgi:hypothetical protein